MGQVSRCLCVCESCKTEAITAIKAKYTAMTNDILHTVTECIKTIIPQIVEKSINEKLQPLLGVGSLPSPVISNAPRNDVPANAIQPDGIRLRGIPETSGTVDERMNADCAAVNKVLEHLQLTANCKITDIRRMGKFKEDQTYPRLIIFNVDNQWAKRLILASAFKLKTYSSRVFISKETDS